MSVTSEELFAELSENFGAASEFDPFAHYAERRRAQPVMAGDIMAELGLPSFAGGGGTRPVYTLFRYADIVAALRDHKTFSSALWLDLFEPLAGRSILGMDGEEHRAWRSALLPVFTRKAVAEWTESIVVPTARDAVARLRASGDRRADLVDFAQRFPMRIIYEIIGLPGDEEIYERFQVLAVSTLIALAPQTDPSKADLAIRNFQRATEAAEQLRQMIAPIVAARRAEGATGKDLISNMIAADFGGGRLNDAQITDFIRGLLQAATDNTTRQFLNTTLLVLERPKEVRDAVRDDRSLLPAAMIEAERYDGPVALLTRITTRDTVVRDVKIPAGSGISLVVNSANRDEDAFTDPEVFDIRRNEATPLVFGLGRHACAGMNIARSEIQTVLEVMFDQLRNLRLDPDAPAPTIRGVHARAPERLPVVWD